MRARAYGREAEAAQNSLLAEHYQLDAESPEAAHHRECENGAEDVGDPIRLLPPAEDKDEEEEKCERHDEAEKKERALRMARRMRIFVSVQVCLTGFDASQFHSRSRRPVSSMKTSSRDGENISRLCSSLLSASSCLTSATIVARRARGVQDVDAVELAGSRRRRRGFLARRRLAAWRGALRCAWCPAERCFSSRGVPSAITLP